MENILVGELHNLALSGKLPHAVLIENGDFDEAFSCAENLVMTILCAEKSRPCGKCLNCSKVFKKVHTDVKIISPEPKAQSIKIDDVRFVKEDSHTLSNEGGAKFYVITHGDLLTPQAQNAMLKVIEEPPKGVYFIFICRAALNLLSTIRSRVQVFSFLSGNSTQDFSELVEEIAGASLANDKFKVMSRAAKIPNDRIFLKNIISAVISRMLEISVVENKSNNKSLIQKIDELKFIASTTDFNANFNLMICNLCAVL